MLPVVAVSGFGVIAAVVLWYVPRLQVATLGLTGSERFDKENEARRTLAQVLAGLFFLFTVFFTWRSNDAAQDKSFTERYASAAAQLSTNAMSSRLAGVYALQSLSQDSPKFRWPIAQLLAAFVNDRAAVGARFPFAITQRCGQGPAGPDYEYATIRCICSTMREWNASNAPIPLAGDVQAALQVLTTRDRTDEPHASVLHFSNVNLAFANLRGGNLSNFAFENADLRSSDFQHAAGDSVAFHNALLEGSSLATTRLTNVTFSNASLADVTFYQSNLTKASFTGSCMSHVLFSESRIPRATFGSSELVGALFDQADLSGAFFEFAQLDSAVFVGANVESADFRLSHGLTRAQVDSARVTRGVTLP